MALSLDAVYRPSDDVVAREIAGELIIVPLTAGIGDMEDELFTLNATGRDIWDNLDGRRSLQQVIDQLAAEYDASTDDLKQDVCGFMEELVKRNIVLQGESA